MYVKYLSRQISKSASGKETQIAWNGTEAEIREQLDAEEVGSLGAYGTLKNIRFFQESADIWCCEKIYLADYSGTVPEKPFTSYGKKSATLKGSMLSMPLESHPKYKSCWNYFLAGAPGVTAVPAWWSTAKDTSMSSANAQKYAWVKTAAENPVDAKGRWHTLKKPLKPGVENYDVATYSITETAKFGNPNAAGKAVAGWLNKIGAPSTTFGISGGNWKCDDSSVFYDGENWFATITWTLSGDKNGWDKDLYS